MEEVPLTTPEADGESPTMRRSVSLPSAITAPTIYKDPLSPNTTERDRMDSFGTAIERTPTGGRKMRHSISFRDEVGLHAG